MAAALPAYAHEGRAAKAVEVAWKACPETKREQATRYLQARKWQQNSSNLTAWVKNAKPKAVEGPKQPEPAQPVEQAMQPQQQAVPPKQLQQPQQQAAAQPLDQAVQPQQQAAAQLQQLEQKPEQLQQPVPPTPPKPPKAAQEACNVAIANSAIQIDAQQRVYDATPSSPIRAKIYTEQKALKALVARKKVLESNYKAQLKWRASQSPKKKRGRPPLEDQFPGFSAALLEVANALAGAHPKRQAESLQLPLSLDDLVIKMDKAGFKVKRSTAYLRLLPHRSSSLEGQRHIRTIPVRLAKPDNNDHTAHQDTAFAKKH